MPIIRGSDFCRLPDFYVFKILMIINYKNLEPLSMQLDNHDQMQDYNIYKVYSCFFITQGLAKLPFNAVSVLL